MKILVLKGGDSSERAVSLRSAAAVTLAAVECGHEVTELDTRLGLSVDQIIGFDVVLPILHGQNGEDGVTQKILQDSGVPFLGANSESSEVSFNKVMAHKALESEGIKMPGFQVVDARSFQDSTICKGPYVIKTIDGGSSVDIVLARIPNESHAAKSKSLLEKHDKMLLEQMVSGQEITVAVLDGNALPIIAINPPAGEEFDYENKYNGLTEEICPVPTPLVSDSLQKRAGILALKVHKTLGVRHLSRTDMIITSAGDIYVLELNTMPGMTDQSLFPKAAKAAGYSMQQLVEIFIKITQQD